MSRSSRIWFVLSIMAAVRALSTDHRLENARREKRIVPGDEIKLDVHKTEYHYVVGIKTIQTNLLDKVVTTRCTGTMMSAKFLLTTAYCVMNPKKITVFQQQNPSDKVTNTTKHVNVIVRNMTEANRLTETNKRKFPNPLFYGDMINVNHTWINPYGKISKRVKALPPNNLALVYLNEPLYSEPKNLTYPVINANPSNFNHHKRADVFGWCQAETGSSYEDPKLTKIPVELSMCRDKDETFQSMICMNITKNTTFCEMDQGGPVIMTDEGDKGMPPSLLGVINTNRAGKYLIYLWPFADWILSVNEEYEALPPERSCSNDSYKSKVEFTNDNPDLIVSYYDYLDDNANQKVWSTGGGTKKLHWSFVITACDRYCVVVDTTVIVLLNVLYF